MPNLTYGQMAANAHAVGGETQTEATAKMTRLWTCSAGFLNIVLRDLQREAQACASMEEYQPVREQIIRVRAVLVMKGAI